MQKHLSRRALFRGVAVQGVALGVGACAAEDAIPSVFVHGVASGDPLTDRVILWTRVSPDELDEPPTGEVMVDWEVATDLAFADVVASGAAVADPERDLTVKVDASGLEAGTTYYYRFRALGSTSPVGRTRTLPATGATRLRLATLSCQSYSHGYYGVLRHLAGRADVDLVLHLGDFIYEYAADDYGEVRNALPQNECVTLADYRTRHAAYRRDPDLRAAMQQHPFVATWDDHETANNASSTEAQNHQPGEGSWGDRKLAGYQAYVEWMPIREQDTLKLWRSFSLGGLADIAVLDTRIWGRDAQIEDPSDPAIADPDRTLLGADQEAWLADALKSSTATWKLLAQQVMFMQLPLGFASFAGGDSWDSYPACRQRVYDTITQNGVSNVVVLTGDIHMSFAAELAPDLATYDPATGAGAVAVELVGPAVSSPGAPFPIEFEGPHIRWAESSRRGYVLLDLTPERLEATYFHLLDGEAGLSVEDPHNLRVEPVMVVAVQAGTARLKLDATASDPPAGATLAPAIQRPLAWPLAYG